MIGVVILMKQRANAQLQKEADERIKAEKKKEISDQLFWGISQIVDCFAICDLKNCSNINTPPTDRLKRTQFQMSLLE